MLRILFAVCRHDFPVKEGVIVVVGVVRRDKSFRQVFGFDVRAIEHFALEEGFAVREHGSPDFSAFLQLCSGSEILIHVPAAFGSEIGQKFLHLPGLWNTDGELPGLLDFSESESGVADGHGDDTAVPHDPRAAPARRHGVGFAPRGDEYAGTAKRIGEFGYVLQTLHVTLLFGREKSTPRRSNILLSPL